MTDVSDGLVADLGHIAAASGVRIDCGRRWSRVPAAAARRSAPRSTSTRWSGSDRRRRLRAGGDVPKGDRAAGAVDGDRGGRRRAKACGSTTGLAGRRPRALPRDAVLRDRGRVDYTDPDVARLVAEVQAEYVAATAARTRRRSSRTSSRRRRAVPGRPARRRAGRDGRLAPATRARWPRSSGCTSSAPARGQGLSRLMLADWRRSAAAAGVQPPRAEHRGPSSPKRSRCTRSSGYATASPGFGSLRRHMPKSLFYGQGPWHVDAPVRRA